MRAAVADAELTAAVDRGDRDLGAVRTTVGRTVRGLDQRRPLLDDPLLDRRRAKRLGFTCLLALALELAAKPGEQTLLLELLALELLLSSPTDSGAKLLAREPMALGEGRAHATSLRSSVAAAR